MGIEKRNMVIGIIGGHRKNTTRQALIFAERVGKRLAELGFVVVTGGGSGIMEAALRGAKSVGGTTFAITKGNRKDDANNYADHVFPTSLDLAFMNVLMWSSDAIIAFDGKFGTMCEIGLALDIGKPIVLFGRHELICAKQIKERKCLYVESYSKEGIEKTMSFILKNYSARK